MNTRYIKRGDTWSEIITWVDEETGTPIDITDAEIRTQLRDKKSGELAVSAGTDTGEITITDAVNGVATQRVEASVMEGVAPRKYSCDIEITYSDGYVQSTPTFIVVVEEDITYE